MGASAVVDRKASWSLAEGDEIAPGRHVLGALGGGRATEAYLAWDDRLSSIVVAKALRPDAAGDERARARLEREGALLQRLAHPVVVRCFAAALGEAVPHLVVEHVEGPSLRTLIRKHGPLPLEQVLPVALRVSGALHYLSSEGVVHLDVKPANVVMDATPRLVDFGIARSLERGGRMTSPAGTSAYMAPEQHDPRAHGGVGPPADVWGLGATLYVALTRRLPFGRAGVLDASARAPELPSDVPRPVAELVEACLARDPSERPPARAIADALEPLVAMLPRRRSFGRARPRLR